MSNRILLGKRYVTSRQGVFKTRCGQVVQGELNVARKVRVTRTGWWRIRSPTREGVCLIPYGGGTNVSDALQVPKAETRMVVSLDMRRMNAIEWIDAENM